MRQYSVYIAMTHMLGGVEVNEIGDCVSHLKQEVYEIKDAFDFLINGI